MIKVVSTSLILIALFGTAPRNWSQDAAAVAERVASDEAVRREARKIQLRGVLSEAQTFQAQDDLGSAAKAYEEAWDHVQTIGVTVDRERIETIRGMSEVRMELARRAQRRGDFDEASKQVERILRLDPRNSEAQAFKADNDKRIQDRMGQEPSKAVTERIPEVQQERINTSVLVNDARVLMEMGKLEEAEAKLKQAVREDPEHRAAFYYLALITERRFAQEARRREVNVKEKIVEVEQTWNDPVGRETLPISNPYARTKRIHTGAGRQAIMRKLTAIVLERYEVPGDLELSEVVKDLARIARDRDVDKQGVNFIIAPFLDKPGPAPAGGAFGFPGAGVDPLTGAPLAPTGGEAPVRVEDYKITIDPPLVNVRLLDVLDAIVKVAKPAEGGDQNIGIKYSLEDYAVVFSRRAVEAEPLYTRHYRVDPNTFIQGLDGVFLQQNLFNQIQVGGGGQGGAGGGAGGLGGGQTAGQTAGGAGPGAYFQFVGGGGQTAGGGAGGGGGGGGQTGGGGIIGVTITNSMSTIQDSVRNFFVAAGIDFQTNQQQFAGGGGGFGGQPLPPQKAIFFNDRTGVLLVRATLKDLDIIEQALQALNITPPQVTIEVRIAEISQRDNKAIGFDWYMGNFLVGNGKAGLQGGTAPSFNDGGSFANPEGTFPNPPIARASTDQLITSGLRSNPAIPAVATLSGILTDPQFRVVIRALEQREGVDLLSAPKVTTLSGRQARISIEDTQTIITGFQVGGVTGGGVGIPGAAPAAGF